MRCQGQELEINGLLSLLLLAAEGECFEHEMGDT